MSYKKMGVEGIIEKVKSGGYKNVTGALRGLGKSNISDAEKEKARKFIEKHFGATGKAASKATKKATKKVVKAAPKKKTSSKKKASKKEAAKKAVKKVATKAASTTRRAPETATRKPRKPKGKRSPSTAKNVTEEQLAEIHLANERVGTIAQAINAMRVAKELSPKIDAEELSQTAVDTLTGIVKSITPEIEPAEPLTPVQQEIFSKTAPTNGAASAEVQPEVSSGGGATGPAIETAPTDIT